MNGSPSERNIAHDKRDHCYVYNFVCEGCGADGEILVPITHRGQFGCPDECGARYIQWYPPTHMAQLMCVVRPVSAGEKHGST